MKQSILISLGLCLIIAVFIWNKVVGTTHSYSKFPYSVQLNSEEERKEWDQNRLKAEDADVLILGDKMALSLTPWIDKYISVISERLLNPLKVYNWADENEGFHRSFYKLLTLKKIPSIIVYFGGSSEFFENILPKEREDLLRKELDCYNDSLFDSLNILFPKIANIFCKSIPNQVLPFKIQEDTTYLTSTQTQARAELQYKLFAAELTDLKNFIEEHNLSLVLITPPIRFNDAPKRVCENTTTKELEEMQMGDLFSPEELIEVSPSNAKSHFIAARRAFVEERYPQAIHEWELSTAFDCDLKNTLSPVFNKIMMQTKSNKIHLIDFQGMIYKDLDKSGPHALFEEDGYPLKKYYDKLTFEIIQATREIFKL